MTDLDRALVRHKLARIIRNVEDLEAVEGLSVAEFRADRWKGTERLLQETVESAADIHLLRVHGHGAPPDYFSSFTRLGDEDILPGELARALAPSTGLRNHLVHEYDALDDEIVLEAVGEARRLFTAYARAVQELIDPIEERP